MTIKQNGGVFGRNPTFNDVTIEGDLILNGETFTGLDFNGSWNASTNSPTLSSGTGTQGEFYIVSVAGTTNLDGVTNWGVGDYCFFNGTAWQRIEGGADGNFVNASVSGTLSSSNLTNASGDITLDASGDIILDADGGDVLFADGGTTIGFIGNSSSNLVLKSQVQDKDLLFKGNDGGSTITALTLDMSNAGTATFNHDIKLGDGGKTIYGADQDLVIQHTGSNGNIANDTGNLTLDVAGDIILDAAGGEIILSAAGGSSSPVGNISMASNNITLSSTVSNADIIFKGNDGGSTITALTLDMSNGGAATFLGTVTIQTMSAGAGTNALRFNTSTGAITFDSSSQRYKDNIRDSVYGLSDVLKLRSTMFEYKDTGRTDVGLIAEELNEVIPELVTKDKENIPESVSYDRLVSVLIKSIQELEARIVSLES